MRLGATIGIVGALLAAGCGATVPGGGSGGSGGSGGTAGVAGGGTGAASADSAGASGATVPGGGSGGAAGVAGGGTGAASADGAGANASSGTAGTTPADGTECRDGLGVRGLRCNGFCRYATPTEIECGLCEGSPCKGTTPYCRAGDCLACEDANPSLTTCPGFCAELQSDPKNCGACGTVCGAEAPSCQDGRCVPCEQNSHREVTCDGICVPANNLNCARCGDACLEDELCNCVGEQCSSRKCQPCEALAGWGYCEGLGCRELTTPRDCGGCGVICSDGQFCGAQGCTSL